jgi:hypothetical protein
MHAALIGQTVAHLVERDVDPLFDQAKKVSLTADFLFPGEDDYADPGFPEDQLAMLAVKTSCKDRWRQVLAEADRIREKHLLTLEPAISRIQTAEMQGQGLQLVLPASLHATYQPDQRAWLMDVAAFVGLVGELRRRQRLLI